MSNTSELKRYLDRLANGPLLDPVTKAGPFLKGVGFPPGLDGAAPVDVETGALTKRRIAIKEAAQRAKPLVVPKKRRHKL